MLKILLSFLVKGLFAFAVVDVVAVVDGDGDETDVGASSAILISKNKQKHTTPTIKAQQGFGDTFDAIRWTLVHWNGSPSRLTLFR